MASITEVAEQFFVACDEGKGWEGCKAYCTPDETFAVQAEPLADIHTLQQYTDWMKGLFTILPDGRYELKALGTDEKRQSVCAYGGLLWDAYGRSWSRPTNRQEYANRLCVRHGICGRQDSAHDENLACGISHEGARLGLTRPERACAT